MNGEKIDMAARRQVTNKLRDAYRKASKSDKGRILDQVMATTGLARSSVRRLLTGPALPDPAEQVDGRKLRSRRFSDDSRALLERVWALMGLPCGKYLVVMLDLWLPLLEAAGDLDAPYVTAESIAELQAMSAATVDRYLAPARERMRIKGISTTKPGALLRNSITIRTCTDEASDIPGVVQADTVAHCGPTLIGEFARTLTMTDIATGWTENCSIRNNASKWIMAGIEQLQEWFPFAMIAFDPSGRRSAAPVDACAPNPLGQRRPRSDAPATRICAPNGFYCRVIEPNRSAIAQPVTPTNATVRFAGMI